MAQYECTTSISTTSFGRDEIINTQDSKGQSSYETVNPPNETAQILPNPVALPCNFNGRLIHAFVSIFKLGMLDVFGMFDNLEGATCSK